MKTFSGFMFFMLFSAALIGWFMNFQNLSQYWVNGNINGINIEWIVSFIGIFVPFIGSVTGYIW